MEGSFKIKQEEENGSLRRCDKSAPSGMNWNWADKTVAKESLFKGINITENHGKKGENQALTKTNNRRGNKAENWVKGYHRLF